MDRETIDKETREGRRGESGMSDTSPRLGRTEKQKPETLDKNAPAVMEVKDLDMFYGSFKALSGVNMKIRKNHITALIGPSGCGKSTYIRSLNRMHEIVSGARVEGSITLDGQDIYAHDVDPVRVRRRIGMVFQKPNPFPTMSIYDNVIAGLKLGRSRKKSEFDEIVERTLTQAALWGEVENKLKAGGTSLSGGQQQRLCIARTLAMEPEVILMDEPASALDPVSTQKIEDAMLELKKDYTVVVVTHNMQQASRTSDYTGFFFIEDQGEPGQLWEFDDTEKIFSNPKRKETEDYVTGRFG